jgi:hypothetical protein
MKRFLTPALTPALMGINAARHLAWYVSYQMSGSSDRA